MANTAELSDLEELVLRGLEGGFPPAEAELRAAAAQDINSVAGAMGTLFSRGLIDDQGFITAAGVRAVWS